MSIFNLSLLFMSFAQRGEYAVIAERAPVVAEAARLAVEELGPVFDGPDGAEASEKLLVRIAYLESRGDFRAVSKDGRDSGILQLRDLAPDLRKLVLSSAIIGMLEGYRALHLHRKTCGGTAERWLGSFASGKCGGAPKVARVRCAALGLCERT